MESSWVTLENYYLNSNYPFLLPIFSNYALPNAVTSTLIRENYVIRWAEAEAILTQHRRTLKKYMYE